MNEPSTQEAALMWHRSYVAGHEPERHLNEPECGWFKTKMVKGGPWVPAIIWLQQEVDEYGKLTCDEKLIAMVLDDPKDTYEIWPMLRPISEAEYNRLRGEYASGKTPAKVVDLSAQPTLP